VTDVRTDLTSAWWRRAVLYQVYIRSFADSDGDGTGDLRGLLSKLDHLSWLGVDAIWLSPVGPSPNADWGYDVADYTAVHGDYGSLADLDEVIAAADRAGMRVLLDLVPNHTSDRHPWFVEARSRRDADHRDWYVWVDPPADGSAPNNWVGSFGGPAWTLDETTGQYYMHNFLPEQPDLNWWKDDVRAAFDDILRFWFDRGIAGFRIDVCHMIVKDAELRDNPPATEDDPFVMQMFGQRPTFNANQPEVHEVLKRWRAIADSYDPPRVLLGETSVDELETLATYYGRGRDELDLAFNFPFIESPFEAKAMADIVGRTEELLPPGAWPVWTGSNHDVSRMATRWAEGEPDKVRMALLMLLTLRGTAVLYQGDEIGLTDGELTEDQVLDPVGRRFWPYYKGRDPERTPMPWDGSVNHGFTTVGATPWLPFASAGVTVEEARADEGSVLHLVRALLALRRASPDLGLGDYVGLDAPDDVWAYRRGRSTVVALNFSASAKTFELPAAGRVTVRTKGAPGDTRAALELAPFEGAVVELA
jgi:alpha-glucosidase